MEAYPSNLQVWRGPALPSSETAPAAPPGLGIVRAFTPPDLADRLYTLETLQFPGARKLSTADPFTLQWFLDAENVRYGRNGRWIPKLMEFTKHAGERLLAIGQGLGTDSLQYARNGASVIVCNSVQEQLALARRNYELRGLDGLFVQGTPMGLPIEDASIDVVLISSLLDETADPQRVVSEVYRVLKPGGKVLALVPAKYDVNFWFHVCFPWHRWLRRTAAAPAALRYSGRGLCKLFGRFTEHRAHKRHLRRADVPSVWRWLPPGLLARVMGRVLVLKAFKPLSAAMTIHLAA